MNIININIIVPTKTNKADIEMDDDKGLIFVKGTVELDKAIGGEIISIAVRGTDITPASYVFSRWENAIVRNTFIKTSFQMWTQKTSCVQ